MWEKICVIKKIIISSLSNKILDNTSGNCMSETINSIISDPIINRIDIATGYWDIPGFSLLAEKLREFLEREDSELRLLIGTDPVVRNLLKDTSKYKDKDFSDGFITADILSLEARDEFLPSIKLLLDYCQKKTKTGNYKFSIRIYKEK